MTSIAQRMFDGFFAESSLEDAIDAAGCEYEKLGWDYYDCSLELHGCAPGFRLPLEAQKIIHDAGFFKCYVNHTDKWETHYGFKPNEPFQESKGWRVSYPHKRGEGEQGILVEEVCQTWPKDWFETGYCRVVAPQSL